MCKHTWSWCLKSRPGFNHISSLQSHVFHEFLRLRCWKPPCLFNDINLEHRGNILRHFICWPTNIHHCALHVSKRGYNQYTVSKTAIKSFAMQSRMFKLIRYVMVKSAIASNCIWQTVQGISAAVVIIWLKTISLIFCGLPCNVGAVLFMLIFSGYSAPQRNGRETRYDNLPVWAKARGVLHSLSAYGSHTPFERASERRHKQALCLLLRPLLAATFATPPRNRSPCFLLDSRSISRQLASPCLCIVKWHEYRLSWWHFLWILCDATEQEHKIQQETLYCTIKRICQHWTWRHFKID